MAQGLVDVIHLREGANESDDHEDVCGRVGELVVAANGKLQRDAEGLHCHHGDRTNGGTDAKIDERILLPIYGRDLVYHDKCEDGDSGNV